MMWPELPVRSSDTDKSRMGRVLVVAGSRGMAGAAALCAEAALRTGCGYVYVATVGAIAPELTTAVPTAILRCTSDLEQAQLTKADLAMLVDACSEIDAVIVGPGLGEGVEAWIVELLERIHVPMVLDADALNAVAREPRILALITESHVMTPHAGEAARLLGWGNHRERVEGDRLGAVEQLCAMTAATVVLKGAGTLVSQRGRNVYVNPTGNAGLAKAGSGDVLSGIIGALIARGMDTHDAAVAGTWLHGRAADLLSHEVGEDSYIPSDLAHTLGAAMRDYSMLSKQSP
jgi:NAD(P)H-hydrate epimerase